jgi:hypothetical protein
MSNSVNVLNEVFLTNIPLLFSNLLASRNEENIKMKLKKKNPLLFSILLASRNEEKRCFFL